jgi:hypothetical protein
MQCRLSWLAAGVGLWIGAPGFGAVDAFKVTTDQTIDPSSLEQIIAQVFARAKAQNNDQKAIALYEYVHHTLFHWAYPTEPAPQTIGPLKVINVYGWSLCGGQHTVLKALYETAGWPCRYLGWSSPAHTTIEVNYDGRWHYLDVFLKCYFWAKDRSHLASQEELAADPTLVLDAVKHGRAAREHLCCGDRPEDVISGVRSRRVVGDSKGWGSVTWRDQGYSPLLRLPSGASLRLDWGAEPGGFAVRGKPPQHSCGIKDFRADPVFGPVAEHYGPRNWSNGRLIYAPDFNRSADVAELELTHAEARAGQLVARGGLGSALIKLPLPYVYVQAVPTAKFSGGEGRLLLSVDAGKTWSACSSGQTNTAVRQRYELWLKAEFTVALAELKLEALVEHNRCALPYLVVGTNRVSVSAQPDPLPEGVALLVRYGYQEATVPDPTKRTRWDGAGITYGPPKIVAQEITRLPAQFDIVVAGNTPPKMLFLERAVKAR